MERLSTGNPRLDSILNGGFMRNSIALVVGAPGSGKTLLAEQCMFSDASPERPGLYLSTVSEPLDKILRYGESLRFFDAKKIGRSVFYDEVGSALSEGGLPAARDRMDGLIKEHNPAVMVIDSFKAFKAFAADESDFRKFLHDFSGRLTARAISALWVGEYTGQDAVTSPEFAVADAVLELVTNRTGDRSMRHLTVRKLRGSTFASGEHAYRLSDQGLTVFPRLADLDDRPLTPDGDRRLSTGIPALDEALSDGYWPGSATLVVGPSGIGKTLMGLHFLFSGATAREPGILLTLQESRQQLRRIIERFGWSVDNPGITVMDRSPVDVYIDELVYELLDCVEVTGARRVVIDSLNDLMICSSDELRFREFVYSLIQRLIQAGISTMLTFEATELFRITRLSEVGMSHLADNVVVLQHVRDGSEMKRALTVLKTRGSSHASAVREFVITSDGILLGDAIDVM